MIPDVGDGDTAAPDDWDADSIADMANRLRLGPHTLVFDSAWRHSAPHPETGGWITYCWENPTAWEILGDDVDREWFMGALHDAEKSYLDAE